MTRHPRLELMLTFVAVIGIATIRTAGRQPPPPTGSPATPDAAELTALIASYAAAWSESDRTARETLLERVFAVDGTYTDPTVDLAGRAALVTHIGRFQERSPGARIEPISVVDAHHGQLRFAWRLALPDGTVVVEGLDYGELTRDGKIKRIVGFFGPLATKE